PGPERQVRGRALRPVASVSGRGRKGGNGPMKPGAVVLAEGREIAAGVVRTMASAGGYVEVVGSVRRGRPIVGDVEVLVRGIGDGEVVQAILATGAKRGAPNKAGARAPWGPRYYRCVLPRANGQTIGLDVFVA